MIVRPNVYTSWKRWVVSGLRFRRKMLWRELVARYRRWIQRFSFAMVTVHRKRKERNSVSNPPKKFPSQGRETVRYILSEQSHFKAWLQQLQSHYYSKWRNNSLHLAREYIRIFVPELYLFRDANNFPRVKLEENYKSRGTDYVQGKYSSIFLD